MSGPPKIPAWQRSSSDDTTASPPSARDDSGPEQHVQAPVPTEEDVAHVERDEQSAESTKLLEQASRFLEDETIRDAPREKKIAFLESKGVRPEDIETLLGADALVDDGQELEEAGERAWSTVSSMLSMTELASESRL